MATVKLTIKMSCHILVVKCNFEELRSSLLMELREFYSLYNPAWK